MREDHHRAAIQHGGDEPGLVNAALAGSGSEAYFDATAGAGSSMHLAGEQLNLLSGIEMLHIPYKGAGGAYLDVMDGRVPLLIDPLRRATTLEVRADSIVAAPGGAWRPCPDI